MSLDNKSACAQNSDPKFNLVIVPLHHLGALSLNMPNMRPENDGDANQERMNSSQQKEYILNASAANDNVFCSSLS
jgi:hypothetical protein